MRTDNLNTLDEVSEGPDETACICMQSRLHGEALVGFLVFLVFLLPRRGRVCRRACAGAAVDDQSMAQLDELLMPPAGAMPPGPNEMEEDDLFK